MRAMLLLVSCLLFQVNANAESFKWDNFSQCQMPLLLSPTPTKAELLRVNASIQNFNVCIANQERADTQRFQSLIIAIGGIIKVAPDQQQWTWYFPPSCNAVCRTIVYDVWNQLAARKKIRAEHLIYVNQLISQRQPPAIRR